eukprot:CAMPEP_0117013616 /NCGR_PEP_ID=MMETSP0472-20121206/11201_1 /TAXON_ID=693140 ORGANISM="Tiarina fusus, Strain LIS" /NCGR_SAMPLE_ID=MMETSP0472 /ASSEMBLY_ACC=CAM_ASM_000603 /LENGTH=678 /DNA_ID=CAMNT_0004716973 /DNA_START=1 /DNA_END=2034 /DNA_ORIENTATION=-
MRWSAVLLALAALAAVSSARASDTDIDEVGLWDAVSEDAYPTADVEFASLDDDPLLSEEAIAAEDEWDVDAVENFEVSERDDVLGVDAIQSEDEWSVPDEEALIADEILPEQVSDVQVDTSSGEGLNEHLGKKCFELPKKIAVGDSNWRIWGKGELVHKPVYLEPISEVSAIACWTDEESTVHVTALHAEGHMAEIAHFQQRECRGLALGDEGTFAVMLFDQPQQQMYLVSLNQDGSVKWDTALVDMDANHTKIAAPHDFTVGDSRLSYGKGHYVAYYAIHGIKGPYAGKDGDVVFNVNGQDGSVAIEWPWGCSHSLSNLLAFNHQQEKFLRACVTDCYPGTKGDLPTGAVGGVFVNHKTHVMSVNANCAGKVGAELGQAAPGLKQCSFVMAWNAQTDKVTKGFGAKEPKDVQILVSCLDEDGEPHKIEAVTSSPEWKADAAISRYGDDKFLIGWSQESPDPSKQCEDDGFPADEDAKCAKFAHADACVDKQDKDYDWVNQKCQMSCCRAVRGAIRRYYVGLLDENLQLLGTPERLDNVFWGARSDPFRETEKGVMWPYVQGEQQLCVAKIAVGAVPLTPENAEKESSAPEGDAGQAKVKEDPVNGCTQTVTHDSKKKQCVITNSCPPQAGVQHMVWTGHDVTVAGQMFSRISIKTKCIGPCERRYPAKSCHQGHEML